MKSITFKEAIQRISNALKIRDYNTAEHLLLKVAAEIPDNLFILITLGNIYGITNRYPQALEQYRMAQSLFPDSPEVYNNLGILYKNAKQFKQAETALQKALSLAPGRADIHYNLGNVCKEQQQYNQAITAYQQALALNPRFIYTYNNLGNVYEKLGMDKEACDTYTRGLSFDPNHPKLRYNLGVIYQRNREYAKARQEFKQAIKVKPGWAEAINNYGVVLGELEEAGNSISMFREVLKLSPRNTKAINNLAIAYNKAGDVEKAFDYYQQALKIDPEYHHGLLNLGILLEENGYYIEALYELNKILRLEPRNLPARIRYASILMVLERYPEAEDQLKFIIRQDPHNLQALRALASLFSRSGRAEEAMQLYHRLMKLDREHSGFYYDLALLFNDKREFNKSEERVKKYLHRNPTDLNARLLLGELYFKQGYRDKAESLYLSLNKTHPALTKPYYYLAKIYQDSGRTEEAIRIFDRLINLQGTRSSFDDLDNINASLKLYEESIARYERDLRATHEESLLKHAGFAFDTSEDAKNSKSSPDSIATVSLQDYQGDPTVNENIIDQGINEPLILIKEEEEIIDLNAPPVSGAVIEIEEEEHVPLSRLLDNQELYDDSPLIKTLTAQQNLLEKQQQLDARQQELELIKQQKRLIEEEQQRMATTQEEAPEKQVQQQELERLKQQQFLLQQQKQQLEQDLREMADTKTAQATYNPGNREEFQQPVSPGYTGNTENTGNTVSSRQSPGTQRISTSSTAGIDQVDVREISKEAIEAIRQSIKSLADAMQNKQQVITVPVYMPLPQQDAAQNPQVKNQVEKQIIIEKTIEKIEGRNLKKELRGFLKKIRQKLDTEEEIEMPANSEKKEQVIGLLEHLAKLQAGIPPGTAPPINLEDLKVKIEFLREKLAGKMGLRKKIEALYGKQSSTEPAGILPADDSLSRVSQTLQFVKGLVHYHPDSGIRSALSKRIENILTKM